MLTIRLQRRGRTNDPSYRVIIVDSKKAPQTGSYLEMLGSYDARTDRIELNAERIKHWLSVGAQTSDTVHNLLVSKKIIDGKKINVLPRKSPPAKEGADSPAEAPAAEAPASPEGDAPAPEAPVTNEVAEEKAAS